MYNVSFAMANRDYKRFVIFTLKRKVSMSSSGCVILAAQGISPISPEESPLAGSPRGGF